MIQRLSSDYRGLRVVEMPSNAGNAFSQNTNLLAELDYHSRRNLWKWHCSVGTSHSFLDSTNESFNITDMLITRRGIVQHLHTELITPHAFKLPIHQHMATAESSVMVHLCYTLTRLE